MSVYETNCQRLSFLMHEKEANARTSFGGFFERWRALTEAFKASMADANKTAGGGLLAQRPLPFRAPSHLAPCSKFHAHGCSLAKERRRNRATRLRFRASSQFAPLLHTSCAWFPRDTAVGLSSEYPTCSSPE
jgi:hypothetical protein